MHLSRACAPGNAPGSSFMSHRQPLALPSRKSNNYRLKPCPPQAIGFDLPGSTPAKPVERQAEDLSRAASSLLLYRNVLKSGPAADFSSIVFNLQKGSPLTLMESYGSFYRGLVSEDVTSWQDYLLDQILRGVDNPFARAASKLERTDYLLPAVRNDLNVFQTLGVTETTLATWCKDVAYNVSEDWRVAASSMKQHATGAEAAAQGGKEEDSLGDWTVEALLNNPTPAHVLAPLNKAQRAALRSAIASKWQWSEATELLNKYYAAHDYGIISMHSVLKWTGDRMQAQDVLKGVTRFLMPNSKETPETLENEYLEGRLEAFLTGNLSNRSNGYVPVGMNKERLDIAYNTIVKTLACLKYDLNNSQGTAVTLAASAVRIVLLPLEKASTLPDLTWTMSQHPRVRFIVVCPGMDQKIFDTMASMSLAIDGFSWPANALFVGCIVSQ